MFACVRVGGGALIGREMGPVGISFQVNCKSAWLNLMSSFEDKKTVIGNTNTVLIVCQVCVARIKFSCPLYNNNVPFGFCFCSTLVNGHK